LKGVPPLGQRKRIGAEKMQWGRQGGTLLLSESKRDGMKQQYAATDEAIRVMLLIRIRCLWMDTRGSLCM
jgi:hypothetical protein